MSAAVVTATHKAEAHTARKAEPGREHGAPEATAGMPRFLEAARAAGGMAAMGPIPPVLIQRQGDSGLPPVPNYQLTPPSLLQPRDPYERFRPDFGLRFQLDPALEARLAAQGRALLAPDNVLATVAPLAPSLAVPRGVAPPGHAAGSPGAPLTPATTPTTPTTPTSPPASPTPATPGGEPEGPRPASPGDVMSAVVALPQVHLLLEDVQTQFTGGLSRYWSTASTGERAGFITSSVVVGAGMLAPVLGFKEPRNFVLPLLNDVVLPVPGLNGYGLEFRFGEHDVMVGAHLDVGLLLPRVWGFGPASFTPISGPPGSNPNEIPPVPRKADEGAPSSTRVGPGAALAPGPGVAADGAAVAAGVRAQSGAGSRLDEGVRRELEPALGADLADVRVHTDARADALARSVHARAFTSGRDLFFRSGRYDPASNTGRRLLAHELVHVGQQARGSAGAAAAGAPLRVSEPHERQEQEAERIAERVMNATTPPTVTSLTGGPVADVQRQPEPGPSGSNPVPAAVAKQMAPPPYTDYFDQMVPAILEAAEGNDKVGLERAFWLITQSYAEQGPNTGLPSQHRNRLFNEQGAVEMENGHIKRVLPGQESEGVSLYNLPQNEASKRGEKEIKTSPTFGYDTPERAAEHHLGQMQKRWGGAWNALTAPKGSFEEFARALKASHYARAEDYDTYLINLQAQVRSQVSGWIGFRLPEMRKRVPQMEDYLDFLRAQRAAAARRAAEEPDPVGSLKAEVASYDAMIQGMELQLEQVRAQLGRLERFAGVMGVQVPQGTG